VADVGLLLIGDSNVLSVGTSGDDMDYDTETVFMITSNVAGSMVSWTAQRDGFILGFISSSASNFALAVNVDPVSAAGLGPNVFTGHVWYPCASNPAAQQIPLPTQIRYPFLKNDIIKLRTISATLTALWLFVGYRRKPT
jgi:hypothetical protein